MKELLLKERLERVEMENYQTFSRVHPLRSFSYTGTSCYVKREDELSCGISGSKVRKYLSLIPYILKQKADEVVVLGTSHSNHVLGISELLCEKGIDPILFLSGRKTDPLGNFLFTSLFVKEENIHWIKEGWDSLENYAKDYAEQKAQEGKKVLVIPKGGNCKEALYGLLTLTLDILRNEEALQIAFDHIFMDAGTSLTALSVILALSFLKKNTHVHVVQLGGDEKEFQETLDRAKAEFEDFIGEKLPFLVNYTLYSPTNAKSFGSLNTQVFTTIKEIAQQEGFLTDPIYTAKLFYEGREILKKSLLKGNVLFIHSGGALSLSGFQASIK